MFRKLITAFLCLSLCLTTIACSSTTSTQVRETPRNNPTVLNSQISDGKYPVQQATYDDGDGVYSLMLLNTPPGTPPVYQTANLQMARLGEEAMTAGDKTYLEVKDNQPVMYLTEDFKIEYVHNVTETQTNPQTGQTETVVVRRESNFWTPFAGAIAGQVVADLLFPRYYLPPLYTPGTVLTGYGGYGNTYDRAVQSYQARHNSAPLAVKNRQVLRTSGNVKSPSTRTVGNKSSTSTKSKSSGSGFGSSDLNKSTKSTRSTPRSTFGSGRKSFGSGGRVRMRRR